jgi:hypothetical protein
MGTSSSHRSPHTPEWERVKQLYRESNPDPREVVARITSALDAATRQEMAGPGVACCLSSLLQASRQVAGVGLAALVPATPAAPPLLAASEAIREQAERTIARHGFASRFSDLALNALATTVFEVGSGGSPELFSIAAPVVEAELGAFAREQRLHGLATAFVGHDFDPLYRYFVTRDTNEFVGGPGLPTVAEASQLRDAVSRHCRESLRQLQAAVHEEALAAALRASDEEGLIQVQHIFSDLANRGLDRLAAGG